MKACFLLTLVVLLAWSPPSWGAVEYSLKVEIAPADVQTIFNAGQHVILARGQQTFGPAEWQTVWSSFQPFPNNYISWNSSGLALYAASAPPKNDQRVMPGSWTYVSTDLVYPFESFGAFGSPYTPRFPLGPGELGLYNNGSATFTFGLASDITVNSIFAPLIPISAELLLAFEHQFFQVNNDLFIFLGAPQIPGTATEFLPSLANSRITAISFASSTSAVVSWDPTNGRFINGPLSS